MNTRKIIHIDMDAFFASVEQHDRPELRGIPVAVGGREARGVLCAASYEARVFGVRSAMPGKVAERLCPHLVFVRPRFSRYKEVSDQIHEVFHRYTDLVEPLSLDEAFLDVTDNKLGIRSAIRVAQQIRQEVFEATGMTCSAGVSYCKFLAKIASDLNKPNGMAVILPEEAEAFLEKLPVEKFFGVGKMTAARMHRVGIRTGADLKARSREALAMRFGKAGLYYYDIVRGLDNRPVQPDRMRKSIGVEETFATDLVASEAIHEALTDLASQLQGRISRAENPGKTLTLKVRYNDFSVVTRSRTLDHDVFHANDILPLGQELLTHTEAGERPVRLLGLSVSNLRQERLMLAHQFGYQLQLPWGG